MAVAVILAAGRGTRLEPISESTPKALVRIAGKPLAEYAAEGVAPLFGKIVIVISAQDKEAFEKHFSGKAYAKKIVYAIQQSANGTAHAILAASKQIGASDFLVLNGDCFFSPEFYRELAGRLMKRAPFIVGKRVNDAYNFGLLKEKNGSLTGIAEKDPAAKEGIINTGAYYVKNDFLAVLAKVKKSPRGELEATDGLTAYAVKQKVEIAMHSGFWTDVGYYWNYLDANAYALEHMAKEGIEGVVEPGVTVKGKVFVGKGSVVKAGTYIEGPVYIGENCVVGPGSHLRPYAFLERDNHVGNSSEVKNSVLLAGANAPHFNYVGDSVLCEEVNFGAGAKTANFRFDAGNISCEVKGKRVDSGRRKLGACIGRGAKIGVNATLNCGVLVGSGSRVLPNAFLAGNLPSGTTFRG
jgi:bifunctional UDP-N-acetylglucosamine pyrophosphorylase/glucosamine-1-phosphate N-acetyltransferase